MNTIVNNEAFGQETQEYAFTDADFQMIAKLANAKYGLFLQESKKALVYSRLAKRLRALNLSNFRDYCELLKANESHPEQTHLLTALTTNVTHFFREKHHFDQLRDEILPDLIVNAREGASLRIWSSACSAGQEAYCIAATILEACPDAHQYDIKVLATDVDPVIVEKAKRGEYPHDQLSAIPSHLHSLMIDPGRISDDSFSMHKKLRGLISFGQLNLMDAWPMKRLFDVIFCRNAAIYFDKETQVRLWSRFSENLTKSGYLMIGHSERLSGRAIQEFQTIGVTSYQKKLVS